jgi:hypothetical protein
MAYAAYVLVPYVGHCLIAEDLSCSLEEAFEVMVKSRRVGTILHPLDDTDPDIDEVIIISNGRGPALGREPRWAGPS